MAPVAPNGFKIEQYEFVFPGCLRKDLIRPRTPNNRQRLSLCENKPETNRARDALAVRIRNLGTTEHRSGRLVADKTSLVPPHEQNIAES